MWMRLTGACGRNKQDGEFLWAFGQGRCQMLQQAVDRLNQRVGKGGTPLERLFPPDGNQAGIDIEEDEEEKMVSVVGQQDFDDALIRPTPGYPICGTVTAIWLTQSPTCTM
ncbi:uncharacterized protein [Hemitrygon akajei]|uniref:uncharacterized protein isoform X2 n=1 Tax=Hemitrygon akajei TaxID=2704970 RepID=UPI003BF9FF38